MDAFYQAMLTRDRRFDGRFFVGVRTTGIYCRPICPARKPLLKNVLFFSTATAAEAAGFRPCLRCRPETAPGSPAWEGTSTTVARAVRLMSQPDLQETGVQGLSERLGLSERRLHQLFMEHLGAPPGQVWQQSRLDFARQLLDETRMTVTQIALQSGFQSIRAFNSAFKIRFMSTPTQLRRERVSKPEGELSLRLPYRPPFPWELLLEFLKGRAAPGVEAVIGKSYRRTIRIGKVSGWIEVSPEPGQMALRVRVVSRHKISEFPFMEINARLRRLFDLAADPLAVQEHFRTDEVLGPAARKTPGLRVPGGWDGFELLIRTILGQQISIKAASTLMGRIVAAYGEPTGIGETGLTYFFPTPERLASADFSRMGMPARKALTLRAAAEKFAEGDLILDGTADPVLMQERLSAVAGIGPWTQQYLAMRALRDPDAFPETDLIIRRWLTSGLSAKAVTWRPWRAYATFYLWRLAANHSTQGVPK